MNLLYILCVLFFMNPDKNEWVTYYKNAQIEILYKKADCADVKNGINQRKIFLKFQNFSSKKIEVSFSKKLIYNRNQKEYTVSPDKTVFATQISPNGIIEGTCENRDGTFFIFDRFLDRKESELKSFDLVNIKVTELE